MNLNTLHPSYHSAGSSVPTNPPVSYQNGLSHVSPASTQNNGSQTVNNQDLPASGWNSTSRLPGSGSYGPQSAPSMYPPHSSIMQDTLQPPSKFDLHAKETQKSQLSFSSSQDSVKNAAPPNGGGRVVESQRVPPYSENSRATQPPVTGAFQATVNPAILQGRGPQASVYPYYVNQNFQSRVENGVVSNGRPPLSGAAIESHVARCETTGASEAPLFSPVLHQQENSRGTSVQLQKPEGSISLPSAGPPSLSHTMATPTEQKQTQPSVFVGSNPRSSMTNSNASASHSSVNCVSSSSFIAQESTGMHKFVDGSCHNTSSFPPQQVGHQWSSAPAAPKPSEGSTQPAFFSSQATTESRFLCLTPQKNPNAPLTLNSSNAVHSRETPAPPNCVPLANSNYQKSIAPNVPLIPENPSVSSSPAVVSPKVTTLVKATNSRIDPTFIPRPLYNTEPITQLGGKRYETDKYNIAPYPGGIFTIVDRGSASCRFIRVSLNQVPAARHTLESLGIPFGKHVKLGHTAKQGRLCFICATCFMRSVSLMQPFPVLGDYENPVPVINLNKRTSEMEGETSRGAEPESEGPLRCTRCHAYTSPFMTFTNSSSAACNFCGHIFDIPRYYRAALQEWSHKSHGPRSVVNNTAVVNSQFPTTSNTTCERSELLYGVVDYAAPKSLVQPRFSTVLGRHQRKGINSTTTAGGTGSDWEETGPGEAYVGDPGFCFVIDTSAAAQQTGFTQATVEAVRYTLQSLPATPTRNVCIVTYDEQIYFYPLRRAHVASSDQKPADLMDSFSVPHFEDVNDASPLQVLVVADVMEPFFPAAPEVLFGNAHACRKKLELVLDSILQGVKSGNSPSSQQQARTRSCGNAALQAAVNLFIQRGSAGVIKMFYGSYPDLGAGSRDKMCLSAATRKDASTSPTLLPTADATEFYTCLVAECINRGVSIDIFAASYANRHIGIGSLGYPARKTGGVSHYYSHFDYTRHYTKLCLDLANAFHSPAGYDCLMKVRCSRGFSVQRLLCAATAGKKNPRVDSTTDAATLRLPRIDAEQSFLYQFQHDGDVPESCRTAYVQCACLHTTAEGFRRVRIMTVALQVTNSLSLAFRYNEVECVVAYYTRHATQLLVTSPKISWRDEVVKQLTEVLFSYRLNCAPSSSSGQLILPDALKALPVYCSGIFKHTAFRNASEVFTDEKEFYLTRLMSLPLEQLVIWMYPRLYVLHRSYTQVKGEKLQRTGMPTGLEQYVYLPPILACSGEKITSDGIFILDNGLRYILYIGESVNSQILEDFLPAAALESPATMATSVAREEFYGAFGETVKKVLSQLRQDKGLTFPWQPVSLALPKSPEETQMLGFLIEDRLGNEPCYVDFLCQLHRAVHVKMEDI